MRRHSHRSSNSCSQFHLLSVLSHCNRLHPDLQILLRLRRTVHVRQTTEEERSAPVVFQCTFTPADIDYQRLPQVQKGHSKASVSAPASSLQIDRTSRPELMVDLSTEMILELADLYRILVYPM